ncbi:hypothetical protein HPP92_004591 [Vanilla planifolia]|uniref:Kelch domain-containing protein 4 n=1 Tax=Vanilla planifolia TaxID=51239 RepID=A0A835VK13_VANPL|nr:hypothetical protein HPP92_004591 [Vanilla planifolia]
MWPSARSGFQLFIFQDEVFLYGGYAKEVSTDKNGSEKGIVYSDMWSIDPRTWEWNKVKKIGIAPGPRAGFSMCIHKKRAVLFGGVVDMDVEGDKLMSLFMNELYGFQLDTRRWYPLELRKGRSSKDKLKGGTTCESSKGIEPSGKINQVESQMCITYEEDENMEGSDEAADVQFAVQQLSIQQSKNLGLDTGHLSKVSDVKVHGLVDSSEMQATTPEVVRPCGRINSCMVVGRDTLYLYGGMMEVKDREITLDDLYSLNLSKLDEWNCIKQASECEWLEVSEDEDKETSEDESNSGSYADETDDDDEGDGDMESVDENGKHVDVGNAVSILRGEKMNIRRKEKRARIEQIRISLGLMDSQRAPMRSRCLTGGHILKNGDEATNDYLEMT